MSEGVFNGPDGQIDRGAARAGPGDEIWSGFQCDPFPVGDSGLIPFNRLFAADAHNQAHSRLQYGKRALEAASGETVLGRLGVPGVDQFRFRNLSEHILRRSRKSDPADQIVSGLQYSRVA